MMLGTLRLAMARTAHLETEPRPTAWVRALGLRSLLGVTGMKWRRARLRCSDTGGT